MLLELTANADHAPASALRAAVATASTANDLPRLAELAARLDLPPDVLATLDDHRDAVVRSSLAGRPQLFGSVDAADPLGGERRVTVLAKLLTESTPATLRLAIARRFLAKPSRVLAQQWLTLPAHCVPQEVAAVVVREVPVPRHNLRDAHALWVRSLPLTETHTMANQPGLKLRALVALAGSPGEDPTNGQVLVGALRTHSFLRDSPMMALALAHAYEAAGRQLTEEVERLLRLLADRRQGDWHPLHQWLTNRQEPTWPYWASQFTQFAAPVTFTTLAELSGAIGNPQHQLDSMDADTLLCLASHTPDPGTLQLLTDWATSNPDSADTPTRAADRSIRYQRQLGRYALLGNPHLRSSQRDRVVDAFTRDYRTDELTPLSDVAPATQVLGQLAGDQFAAVWLAGAVENARSVSLGALDDDRQVDLMNRLSARADPESFRLRVRNGQCESNQALIAVVGDPGLRDPARRALPWTVTCGIARRARDIYGLGGSTRVDLQVTTDSYGPRPQEPAASVCSAAVSSWLLNQLSRICLSASDWAFANTYLASLDPTGNPQTLDPATTISTGQVLDAITGGIGAIRAS